MTFSGEMTRRDRLMAFLMAVALGAFAWLWSPSYMPPTVWESVSIAAGVRPPTTVAPALWQIVVSPLLRNVSLDTALNVLGIAGNVALALIAYLFAALVMRLLPQTMRLRMVEARTHRLMLVFAVLPSAALFCCSDPVWRAGMFFAPITLELLLLLGSMGFFLDFVRGFKPRHLFLSAVLLGPVAAEDPFGFLLLAAYGAVIFHISYGGVADPMANPLSQRDVFASVQRWITFSFLASYALTIAADVVWFGVNDGYAALGFDGLKCGFDFFRAGFAQIKDAASGGGWFFFVWAAVAPFVVAVGLVGRAVDDEKLLPYWCAVTYVALGMVAYLQLGGWKTFWYWHWEESPIVIRALFLLVAGAFLSALTVAYALSVLVVEVHIRRYEQLSAQILEALAGVGTGDPQQEFRRRVWLRRLFILVPVVLVALSVGLRRRPVERGMMDVVGDFIRLTAEDCAGAKYILTDGSCDAALELECRRMGHDAKALSMMSGGNPREQYLRVRGEPDGDNRASLEIGTAQTLRGWVRGEATNMPPIAVQLGFELWRHEQKPVPMLSGSAGHVAGMTEERARESVSRAHEIGERMLALAEDGAPGAAADPALKRVFNFTNWRIARMARVRADEADMMQRTEEALRENAFADELDERNPAYRAVRRENEWILHQRSGSMTPREGLRFALERADFMLGRAYARQVLLSDPDDVRANFALGMSYVSEERYSQAAEYLRRCLKRAPKEPAALNNLAVAEMHLGRLEEAEKHAQQALDAYPDSGPVKRTLDKIRKMKAK